MFPGLLDIPVYKSRVHSLHVLFSLYTEFKNSQVAIYDTHSFINSGMCVTHTFYSFTAFQIIARS